MSSDFQFEFESLIVYKKSLLFIKDVYKSTEKFPKAEEFKITSQFTRASVSIALNISEGSGGTKPEFRNFLRFAKRSVRECIVCITVSTMLNYLTLEQSEGLRNQCIEISKMLNGLIKSIN
ncbi:MAG: four helix bundle protein [Bacteroidia bacterium]